MHILLADDNREFCATLGEIITGEGWQYDALYNPVEVLDYLRKHHAKVGVVLLDVDFNHPTLTGLNVLAEVRQLYPHLPVVMISGTGSYGTAVQATHLGAENFIPKGDISRKTVQQVLYAAMERANRSSAHAELLRFMQDNGIIGRSQIMLKVAEAIVNYGNTELNVLITGETGTGKRIAARSIHAASRRAKGNFVTVDIPNITPSLFQSELFGHTRNAFTGAGEEKIGQFQNANNGTLFLDEIGDLPLESQASLLLPIDNKIVKRLGSVKEEVVNVRIVSATDRDLPAAIKEGKFRDQLYHRLRECEVRLPPLRDRREDIPLIAEYYTAKHNTQMNEQRALSASAMEFLQGLSWPGNVRQLESLLRRVLQTASHDMIQVADIVRNEPSLVESMAFGFASSVPTKPVVQPTTTTAASAVAATLHNTSSDSLAAAPLATAPQGIAVPPPLGTPLPRVGSGMSLKESEDEFKRQLLINAMTELNGNVSKVASRLQLSRETVHQWLKKFGMESSQFKKRSTM